MRVLVLTTAYPRWAEDVAGNFVARWCESLAARGHAVHVVAPADGAAGAPAGRVSIQRFQYALHPRLCYGAGIRDNLRDPRAAAQLPGLFAAMAAAAVRAARAFRPDVVASHWVGPATLAGRLACAAAPGAARHVSILHSEGPARARVAAALADRVVAVSTAAGKGVEVVPLGVELAALPARAEARVRLGIAATRFVVLGLGRLVPVKGFARLPAAAPDGALVLVAGEGPERAAIALAAAAPAVRARGVEVRLLGAVAGARKAEVFAAADVLCVPSRSEGLPLVVREAQRAGLPVVASAVGALPDVVAHGRDGWLVPPGDDVALAAGLAALAADAPWRAALAAESARRGQAEARAWDLVAADWERVLAEVA